jgi:hypothetical protein
VIYVPLEGIAKEAQQLPNHVQMANLIDSRVEKVLQIANLVGLGSIAKASQFWFHVQRVNFAYRVQVFPQRRLKKENMHLLDHPNRTNAPEASTMDCWNKLLVNIAKLVIIVDLKVSLIRNLALSDIIVKLIKLSLIKVLTTKRLNVLLVHIMTKLHKRVLQVVNLVMKVNIAIKKVFLHLQDIVKQAISVKNTQHSQTPWF